MAKVIEIYTRDVSPNKATWVRGEQRGKLIEFPKEMSAPATIVAEIREADEGNAMPVLYFGCF